MSLYEGMFMMDNRQANRDWEGALAALTALITKHGGEILRTVKWGERRLAYEIAGRRRATYVLVYFHCGGDGVNRIYRECELADLIHRALILKIAELPPEDAPRGDEIPDRHHDRSRGPGRGRRGPAPRRDRPEQPIPAKTPNVEKPSETESPDDKAKAPDPEEKVEAESSDDKAKAPDAEKKVEAESPDDEHKASD